MESRLAGKVAWISGGASGIGEATALLFAEQGASVAIVDVLADDGEHVAQTIRDRGARATFYNCDVADEPQVRNAIGRAADEFGSLHIIVNCAGIVHVKLLHEYSEQEWDRLTSVNVKSIFFALKYGLEHLCKNRKSYMVNIGSISSFVGQSSTPAYNMSKGAVLQLSRSIALDYAAQGLRCNCVCPGITDTPMLRYHLSKSSDPERGLRDRLRRVPMGIAMEPSDIAKAVLYLSCEDSSGVNGTSLIVDGGYLAAAEWQPALSATISDSI